MFEFNFVLAQLVTEWFGSTDARLLIWVVAQITLVALATYATVVMARRIAPAYRAIVSLLGLACMTTLPLVMLLQLSEWSWGEWLPQTAPVAIATADRPETAHVNADQAVVPLAWWEQALLISDRLFQGGRPDQKAAIEQTSVSNGMLVWLPWVLIGCMFLGSARWLMGLWMVRRMRRAASVIDDPALEAELDQCARHMGVREGLTIAESSTIGTPAIVGWRQPWLLVPASWRSWSEDERRAVLAHELAHVRRGDYLITATAQAAVAVHFFHPLAHALVSRLRLDQELAADHIAASLVGGSQRYIEILAGLALHQPAARTPGPAQAFLPTRHMFVRRLEMLRYQNFRNRGWSRLYTTIAVCVLASLTLLVSGLRPIEALAQDKAGQQTSAVTAQAPDVDLLKLIPPSVGDIVVVIDAAALLKSEPARQMLDAAPEFVKSIPFDVLKLEQAVVVLDPTIEAGRADPLLLLKFAAGTELPELSNSAAQPDGNRESTPQAAFAAKARKINERIIAVGGDEALRLALGKVPTDNFFQPLLARHQGQTIRVAARMNGIRQLLSQPAGRDDSLLLFAPLWEKVNTLSLGIEVGESLNFAGELDTKEPKQVADTVSAAKTLATNFLERAIDIRNAAGSGDTMQRMMLAAAVAQARKFLESSTIEPSATGVHLTAKLDSGVYAATALLLPAVQSARTAALRTQSQNNLKQIMLALHNYGDAHNHFPSAVIRDPESGVLRSWRVEILPFIEQQQLYNQYRKNEPWDSEANLKVLKQIPQVYMLPGQSGTTETPYLAIAGEGSALALTENGEAPRLSNITDGTSNTVMVVETLPMVPWTKPVDAEDVEAIRKVAIRASDRGFNAAFGDGSVRFISNSIDATLWKALTTRAGGELINN